MTLGVYLDSMFDVILKKENVEDMKSYIFLRGGGGGEGGVPA